MGVLNSIGIVGAGTAGYLTALCIRKALPHLNITIMESPNIPIIGVGEATTSLLVGLLHDVLKLDIQEFYREVKPTWKMGLRFWWGAPGNETFDYPFGPLDLEYSHYYLKDLKYISIVSLLMEKGKSFLIPSQGNQYQVEPIDEGAAYAYHLDNKLFVDYLRKKSMERGIHRIETEIAKVNINGAGNVECLISRDGQQLNYDLYIDCTGFRSEIMGNALNSNYISYSESLLTDRAIVGVVPNKDPILPYSIAATMKHGWKWRIQLRDEDHIGYVFASDFCSEEDAFIELKSHYPALKGYKTVPFRSGRRSHFWKGNVVAMGNAYGFLEPLDATGIHLTINTIQFLVDALSQGKVTYETKDKLNFSVGQQWDYIRWLIAVQFKFNRKLKTDFWTVCQNEIDISDHQELLEIYESHGMISLLPRDLQALLIPPQVYRGLVGNNVIDTKLLGMGILPKMKRVNLSNQEASEYHQKLVRWKKLSDDAVNYSELLIMLDQSPECIDWNRLRFSYQEKSFEQRFYSSFAS